MALTDNSESRPEEPRLKSKEDLSRFLDAESRRYGRKNAKLPLICFREVDLLWKHNYLLRKAEYYWNNGKKIRGLWFRYRLRKLQCKYLISIPLNTCDCGLKIMHLGTIIINPNARLGKNCTLHANTGIVAGGRSGATPTLGDGIVVGMGAVILGDIHLADGIAVGANALVNKNFSEKNIAVAGVPARKISENGAVLWNRRPEGPGQDQRVPGT